MLEPGKRRLHISALAAGLLAAPVAFAADGLYLGVTGGVMSTDRAAYDEAVSAGLLVGYEFLNVAVGDIAAEAVYTTTLAEADIAGIRGGWEMDTLAAYGAFRTAGPVYVKARAGVVDADVKTRADTDSSTRFSAGLGIGLSVGIAQFELEYTTITDDVDFIGLTINLKTPL